jgi:mercuric ion transport protein
MDHKSTDVNSTDVMNNEPKASSPSAGTSVISAVSLTLLGTTCCALPIALVALGAGGAVASMASTLPWLVALSEYKLATFAFTAAALGYSWWQVRRLGDAASCSISDARRLRVQNWILRGATGIFAFSLFAAYGLLALVMWFDNSG